MAWALQERDAKGADSSTKEGHLIPTRRGGFFDEATPGDGITAFNARQDPDSWQDRTGPLDTDGSTQAVAFKASHFTRGKDGALNGSDAGATSDMRPVIAGDAYGVRRLTPTECEKLMSWPDVEKRATFSACFDHQKNCADAEQRNLRLPSSVGNVGPNPESLERALFVKKHSPPEKPQTNAAAHWYVEINAETRCVALVRRPSGFSPLVSFAVGRDACDLLVRHALIVLGYVESQATGVHGRAHGRAARQTNGIVSTPVENGKCYAGAPGCETVFASDAGSAPIIVCIHDKGTSTISEAGSTSRNCDSRWITLCSSVAHVISGFIHEKTQASDLLEVEVVLRCGWTFGFSDSVRYRMCGNGVVSNVAEWIGRRIVRFANLP